MTTLQPPLEFCKELHYHFVRGLQDPVSIRQKVEELRPRNSFAESCFCKGCVLPIVDTVASRHLGSMGESKAEIHHALRCEGFDTPLYVPNGQQSGFSSHSRSNSYHPGDKSGRRPTSRRSPDFCIRSRRGLRLVGEIKFLPRLRSSSVSQIVHELRDYLSIRNEPTSDWGHDFGFGLVYAFQGDTVRQAEAVTTFWDSGRIFLSIFR